MRNALPWGVVLAALLMAACTELPLAPAPPESPDDRAPDRYGDPRGVPVSCTYGSPAAGASAARTVVVHVPGAEGANGRTLRYTYRLVGADGGVRRSLTCALPATGAAVRWMNAFLGADGPNVSFSTTAGGGEEEETMIAGCVLDGHCELDGLVVVAPESDCIYQYTGSCEDPFAPTTGGSSFPGQDDHTPGGGGGNTAPPPAPADTVRPDTACRHADEILNDPAVSRGLDSLWRASNPDANLAQRREQAAWIVQTPTGRRVIPWTGATNQMWGCATYNNPQLPAGATVVAWVHTHPFAIGTDIPSCELSGIEEYNGRPSDTDRQTAEELGQRLGRSSPVPGYVMDKDGYHRFEGRTDPANPRTPRCGY